MPPLYFDSRKDPIIYHYTSLGSARAIVESMTFRLSEYTTLNDSSEFVFARNKLINVLNSETAQTDERTKEFIVSAMEELISISSMMIGSFTLRNDDLGQWKSYADNGSGCVLGIDARYIERDAGVRTSTVIYDEDVMNVFIQSNLKFLQTNFERLSRNNFMFTEYVRRFILELFSFKNPAFSDEREVRIARMVRLTNTGSLVDIVGRGADLELTPVLPVESRDGPFGNARFIALPLTRKDGSGAILSVRCGPTMASSAISDARAFFEERGIEVSRSTIPYRTSR